MKLLKVAWLYLLISKALLLATWATHCRNNVGNLRKLLFLSSTFLSSTMSVSFSWKKIISIIEWCVLFNAKYWLSIDYYRKLIKQCQFFIQESSSWWLLCLNMQIKIWRTRFIWYNRVLTEKRADNLFVTAFTKKQRTYSGKERF